MRDYEVLQSSGSRPFGIQPQGTLSTHHGAELHGGSVLSLRRRVCQAVPTVVPGHGLGLDVVHGQEGEVGELVGTILQAGHGGGGQGVGMLRERVQHLPVHIPGHQVPDQLDLSGMV